MPTVRVSLVETRPVIVTVPVPPLPAVKTSAFEFKPFVIVIV